MLKTASVTMKGGARIKIRGQGISNPPMSLVGAAMYEWVCYLLGGA